jgi:predicted nuclease of restriction endonuclease-like RecB superfamily
VGCFTIAFIDLPTKKTKTRNKFEQRILDQIKRSKVKHSYESEKIPYTISGNYIPDFILELGDDRKIYLETKGHFRPEAKRKMVAVKRQHPDLDIRIIFYSARKPYIRWAEKHGFKYAFHSIPDEWLKESI